MRRLRHVVECAVILVLFGVALVGYACRTARRVFRQGVTHVE